MRSGVIDLEAYYAKTSYSSLRALFYFYDKLYTCNFYEFERDQLHREGGSLKHYDKIKLLVDHELLEVIDRNALDKSLVKDDRLQLFLKILDEKESDYSKKYNILREASSRLYNNSRENASIEEIVSVDNHVTNLRNSHRYLISVRERLYGIILSVNLEQEIYPTLSMDSFDCLDFTEKKTFICNILVRNIPIPDESIPLIDIIQYKNEEVNKLHYKRLLAWMNRFSKEDLNESEIVEEIESLLEENRRALTLAGMKYRLINMEFALKILPNIIEKLAKLKFSELFEPYIKMRQAKISLFEDEVKAKGNELAFIVNLQKK